MGNGTSEETERYWFAFILYSVKKLIQKNDEGGKEETENTGFTLCRILRAAKLNLAEFFKEIPQFVVKAGPILSNRYGTDWGNRLEAHGIEHLVIPTRDYLFAPSFVDINQAVQFIHRRDERMIVRLVFKYLV